MRKTIIGLALATTVLATPAMARDGSWYMELDAGGFKLEDTKFAVGATADAVTVDHDIGADAGFIVGYDFGGFRLEAEASYKGTNPDGLTASVGVPRGSNTSLFTGRLEDENVGGKHTALSFMANGLLDFGADDGLQGFIGGGVGYATVKHELSTDAAGPGWLDDSDGGFAWQAIAGVRTPISNRWDLGLKYRLFNVDNVDMVDGLGREVSSKWRSHSLLLTLAYNFITDCP